MLSSSNVSSKHAKLTISGDEIVLEDVGSTNGTSVGTVENKTRRAFVSHSDSVFFGSSEYRVSELVKLADTSAGVRSQSRQTVSDKLIGQNKTRSIAVVASVLLLLAGFWLSADRNPKHVTADSPADIVRPVSEVGEHIAVREAKTADSNSELRQPAVDPLAYGAPPISTDGQRSDVSEAIYIVICRASDSKTPFRVGTAFATLDGRIVTSASVIGAIQSLLQGTFTSPSLYSPHLKQMIPITNMQVHPRYKSDTENIDLLIGQSGHDEELIELFDSRTVNDLGVLETSEVLPAGLSLQETHPRPGQKLMVFGYPFDVDDPFFDASVPISLDNLDVRAEQLRVFMNSTSPALGARVTDNQMNTTEFAFIGSPVVNQQHEVVGVYVRNRPRQGSEFGTAEQFDGTLIGRLSEISRDE